MTDESILKVIREVAKEEEISSTVLERAWRNQFKVLKDTVEGATKDKADTFKVVYLKYFGKFIPNRAQIRRVVKNKIAKREREGKADS